MIAAPSERATPPTARPCFDLPSEGELVANGKKLVGSAQWRNENAWLQHGSILVDDDQSSLPSFASPVSTGDPDDAVPEPATLSALLRRTPDANEVAGAMFDAVRSLEDADAVEISEQEIRQETLRIVPQFLDERWTWRR